MGAIFVPFEGSPLAPPGKHPNYPADKHSMLHQAAWLRGQKAPARPLRQSEMTAPVGPLWWQPLAPCSDTCTLCGQLPTRPNAALTGRRCATALCQPIPRHSRWGNPRSGMGNPRASPHHPSNNAPRQLCQHKSAGEQAMPVTRASSGAWDSLQAQQITKG